MATPQVKRERIGYLTLDVDGDDRENALDTVNTIFDEAEKQGYTNVRLSSERVPYEDGYEFQAMGDRMETAEEAILRERLEADALKRREDYQRAQYEELRKKFGS